MVATPALAPAVVVSTPTMTLVVSVACAPRPEKLPLAVAVPVVPLAAALRFSVKPSLGELLVIDSACSEVAPSRTLANTTGALLMVAAAKL